MCICLLLMLNIWGEDLDVVFLNCVLYFPWSDLGLTGWIPLSKILLSLIAALIEAKVKLAQ